MCDTKEGTWKIYKTLFICGKIKWTSFAWWDVSRDSLCIQLLHARKLDFELPDLFHKSGPHVLHLKINVFIMSIVQRTTPPDLDRDFQLSKVELNRLRLCEKFQCSRHASCVLFVTR